MGKDSPLHQSNGIGKHLKPQSIYDYPEHLNPFYQDDNHKRLRFWALKKGKDGRSGNSFSMSNLRDLWAFKSFSLKKKSSTLGINKTSESPPPLRKYGNNDCLYDSNFNTYDSRYRQTIGGVGSATDVAFERNAPYRATVTGTMNPSSGKSYDTQSDIVFNRHESYRNTIQNVSSGKSRYNQSSVTPVLNQRRITSSVSQSSLRSTNPFDDDYENNENTSPNQQDTIVENGGVIKNQTRRPYRKKRRAPPPPIVQQYVPLLQEESGPTDHLRIDEVELKIVEEESPSRQETPAKDDDLTTISMITAEIETLYKDLEKEEEKLKVSTECQTPGGRIVDDRYIKKEEITRSTLQNDSRRDHIERDTERPEEKVVIETIVVREERKRSEPIIETIQVVEDRTLERTPPRPPQRSPQAVVVTETIVETPAKVESQAKPDEVEVVKEIVTQTNTIEMRIHEEKEIVEPVISNEHPSKVTFKELSVSDVHLIREPSVISNTSTVQSDPASVEPDEPEEQELYQVQTRSYTIDDPLMIVENRESDHPVPSTFPRRSEGSVTAFEIKYKQLKDAPDSRFILQRRRSLKEKERKEFMQRALNLDRSHSVDIRRNLDEEFESYNYYNNSAANGEKRRSVKEIIDSINKNQSLLQATNYTPLNGKYDYNNVASSTNTSTSTSTNNKPVAPIRRISEPFVTSPLEREPEMKLLETVELRHTPENNGRGSYYDNVPDLLEQLDEQSSTFEKCSPRNGSGKFDWNPVPKPRRSRNFSEERDVNRSEGLKEYY